MAQLCRQISIDKPQSGPGESVFSYDILVPEVPKNGARIHVACAGVCYKKGSFSSDDGGPPKSPMSIQGIKDTSLFEGYEVAGTIDALGEDVPSDFSFAVNDKVIVYPYDGLPSKEMGYAEYISIPDVKYLVKIPDTLPLSIAATLPSGGLWAMNAVQKLVDLKNETPEGSILKVLVVGTGGLSLWILAIAKHIFCGQKDVTLTVAAFTDDKISRVKDVGTCNVVSWDEKVYEPHLIERTRSACDGMVDVCINYNPAERHIPAIMNCMRKGGAVLVGLEYEDLKKKFSAQLSTIDIRLEFVEAGTLQQLEELVKLVYEGKIVPPKLNVFPAEKASDIFKMLCKSQIDGRAVLEFKSDDEKVE